MQHWTARVPAVPNGSAWKCSRIGQEKNIARLSQCEALLEEGNPNFAVFVMAKHVLQK